MHAHFARDPIFFVITPNIPTTLLQNMVVVVVDYIYQVFKNTPWALIGFAPPWGQNDAIGTYM